MTTQAIRDAVQDGDYGRAAELLADWAEALPPREESLREIAELARWVRGMVLCANAHTAARIQRLREQAHAVSAYSRPDLVQSS